ncbi:MAG: hypothetical protein AAFQ63_08855 [Cyanobacteria bacterium J06621_11]
MVVEDSEVFDDTTGKLRLGDLLSQSSLKNYSKLEYSAIPGDRWHDRIAR